MPIAASEFDDLQLEKEWRDSGLAGSDDEDWIRSLGKADVTQEADAFLYVGKEGPLCLSPQQHLDDAVKAKVMPAAADCHSEAASEEQDPVDALNIDGGSGAASMLPEAHFSFADDQRAETALFDNFGDMISQIAPGLYSDMFLSHQAPSAKV